MTRYIALFFCSFFTLTLPVARAQSGNISSAEELSFALEVKQLDEFIERFNYEENTMVLQYIKTHFPNQVPDRTDLLKTLFNHNRTNWNEADVLAFIRQVADTCHPEYLNFFEGDWYAELECSVFYNGKPEKATLIMQIQLLPNRSSKWVIRGVKTDFLYLPREEDESRSLNPVSHGTDFMGLGKALADVRNIRNYVTHDFSPDQMTLFLSGLMDGRIVFRQVDQICYHFLQVEGWVFQLERFLRNSGNSGWLINDLLRLEGNGKEKYLTEILSVKS
ncbi:MAG: hypothetical protein SF052_07835 [Bacteroidia bacterium]|nr:hypothetical protein [Bacteroidia bacterium]